MRNTGFLLAVLLLMVLVGQSAAQANTAPVVSNVIAAQRSDGSKLVDIYYNLADADGDACTVWVAVSDDGGTSWRVPADDFSAILPERGVSKSASAREQSKQTRPCIFIGHGRNSVWARVKSHIEDDLNLAVVTYEAESRTGESIVPVLEMMLDQATFAVIVLTAEDETAEGSLRPRLNVVHEAGLFQGRLGFKRAVLLVQQGVETFSNVDGLQHIPFTGGSVEQSFYELGRALRREGQIT